VAQVETERFICEACAKSYRWKPELAGRRVKCKCGHVMTAPLSPPEDGLYAMGPEPDKPRPMRQHSAVPTVAKSSVKTTAVSKQTTSPIVGYAGSVRNSQPTKIEDSIGGSLIKEIYIPAAIVLIGMFLQVGLISSWHFTRVPYLLPQLGVHLGINLVLSFIGVLLVAKLMDISFGSPGPMVLKLTAIALAVPAVADMIGRLVGHDSFFVAMMVSAILYAPLGVTLFWWLFDMEIAEALYCQIVIWLVNQWAVVFLMGMIFKV